ncbi:hypothetical protein UVI_02014870 [Ustilaginoidea virens]|nr:hypothetical protein UVI_02014870 [Ustilaginoidea virens]
MESTLAFRRSVHRLRSSPDNPLRLPQPIDTSVHTPSPPMTSLDTSILSDESFNDLHRDLSRDSDASKKLQKKLQSPRKYKWNLFGRSQGQANDKTAKGIEQVGAHFKMVEKRPVAFYAILDASGRDEIEPTDIQEVLRDADVYRKSPRLVNNDGEKFSLPQTCLGDSRVDSAPPILWHASPNHLSNTTLGSSSATDWFGRTMAEAPYVGGKRSRLPQVGRIPPVVKTRSETGSPRSFSKPFWASPQPGVKPRTEIHDPESIATGPTPPKLTTPPPDSTAGDRTSPESRTVTVLHGNSSQTVSPGPGQTDKEFLSFSPRKNSNGTIYASSCSSGAANPFATATAVIPKPDDPPAEDEVWDEYNDLLGEESTKGTQSATSSKGIPFPWERYLNQLSEGKEALESPIIAANSGKTSTCSKAPTHSSSHSADMTEHIRTVLQPKPSPSSTVMSVPMKQKRVQRDTQAKPAKEMALKRDSASSGRTTFSDRTSCSSNDASPLAQVNLRVGSMTVSKWLTFGHVLFSDIRHGLSPTKNSLKHHSVLVIDGLGNDDWSFYAAETYPGASFYNLSPRAPLPAELGNSPTGFPLSPPNHHQIQYMSHSEKFPFAPQSFDALVYRFPVVAPESHYRNILSEARRVLRPNGYIELSILDSDLNNMGNRGRRSIRRLKEQIRLRIPDATFASTPDLVVRLLGRVGFSNIKAARVGIPVATCITRSRHVEKDKQDSGEKRSRPSLAEMMSDNGPLADENITRMVTRVGRWWYTRCYENAAGNKSIWNDKALLSECEQSGTSLKLMVCCARVPDRVTTSL